MAEFLNFRKSIKQKIGTSKKKKSYAPWHFA